ncbi:MAG: hypothetical protein OK452_02010 [Thaumarchaeota archaeon]|nr:hypothetical protein [Nitrososphaerota archaeon]
MTQEENTQNPEEPEEIIHASDKATEGEGEQKVANPDSVRQVARSSRMKRRNTIVAIVILAAFLFVFLFVPVIPITTHGSDQLAFLRLPATESLSCVVFGIGAGNWPSPPYEGLLMHHYQLGCPPLATN